MRVGLGIERRHVLVHVRRRVIAPLRALDALQRALARVEEAESEVAHQPLEARARGEVEAGRAHVDRNGARALNDVGVDERAVRVREIAHGLEVVLEAVVHRDERDLDELRLLVDDASRGRACRCDSRAASTMRRSSPCFCSSSRCTSAPSKCSASVTTLPSKRVTPSPLSTRFSPVLVFGM